MPCLPSCGWYPKLTSGCFAGELSARARRMHQAQMLISPRSRRSATYSRAGLILGKLCKIYICRLSHSSGAAVILPPLRPCWPPPRPPRRRAQPLLDPCRNRLRREPPRQTHHRHPACLMHRLAPTAPPPPPQTHLPSPPFPIQLLRRLYNHPRLRSPRTCVSGCPPLCRPSCVHHYPPGSRTKNAGCALLKRTTHWRIFADCGASWSALRTSSG